MEYPTELLIYVYTFLRLDPGLLKFRKLFTLNIISLFHPYFLLEYCFSFTDLPSISSEVSTVSVK